MPCSRPCPLNPLFAVLAAALLVACATRPFDPATEPGGAPLPITTSSAVVLTGRQLSADPGWTVLDAIRRAMPQLKVSGYTSPNRCPILQLRGRDSLVGSSDPSVYVDGTRTVDTCPLVTIQAMQTRRVEVYPLGVTPRPGYPSSGHGLILVFMQRSDSTGS